MTERCRQRRVFPLRISLLLVALLVIAVPVRALELWTSYLNVAGLLPLVSIYEDQAEGDRLTIQIASADLMLVRLQVGQAINWNPHVVILPSDQLAGARGDQLMPLPPEVLKPLNNPVTNGRGTALILGAGHSLVLYYNRRLVDEEPASFEALLDASRNGPVLSFDPVWPFGVLPFLNNAGLLDGDNRVVTEDPLAAVIRGLKAIKRLIDDGKVPAQCQTEVDTCAVNYFINGVVPFAIAGSWDYHSFKESMGDDLGVMAIPPWHGRSMKAMRFPAAMALGDGFSEDANSAEHVVSLARSINTLQRSDRGRLLFGPAPKAEAMVLPSPYREVMLGSVYSPSDAFFQCLLIAMPTFLQPFFNGQLNDEELRSVLAAQVGEAHCGRP